MKILIGCEYSGIVRDAFIALGHDAISCDILPTERPGPHLQCDVRDVLGQGFDLLIGHPPCTYLCNSGVRWLHTEPGRWQKMRDGAAFFRDLMNAPIPRIAIENPVMHGYAKKIIGRAQSQTIQPFEHGHGEVKATCLWLKNLPLLKPTHIVEGREARIHKLPPSEDRGKLRSLTYPGVAAAFAAQWGIMSDVQLEMFGRAA